jgi:hypothetical protein
MKTADDYSLQGDDILDLQIKNHKVNIEEEEVYQ